MPATTAAGTDRHAKLARTGLIALLGSVVNGIAALGVVLALTRGLGDPAESGAVFSAMAVFNIAYLICTLGAEVAVVRAVARDDTREKSIVKAALIPTIVTSAITTAALFLARGAIADAIGDDSGHIEAALSSVVPFIPAAAITSVLMATTRGRGVMTPTAIVERISRPTAQLGLLAAAALLGAGVASTSLAWSATFGIAVVPAAVLYRRGRPIADPRPDSDAARTYWEFAAPQAMTTVFQVVLRWADIILVAALADAATAAIYTAATRLLLAGNFLNLAIVQASSPMISRALARGDRSEAQDVLRTGTAWLVTGVWPGYLLLMVFGGKVLGLFGDGYDSGATALAILAGAMLVASAVGPIESVLLMGGGSRLSLGNNIVAVAVNIALNVALIPTMGIEGAALAWATSLLITNLVPLRQVRVRLGLDPFGRGTVTAGAAALITIAFPAAVVRVLVDPTLVSICVISGALLGAYLIVVRRFRDELHLDDLAQAIRPGAHRSAIRSAPPESRGSVASRR